MQPDWINQLIIPLGAELAVFIIKALIVAFVATWLLNKYVKPFFPKQREAVSTEQSVEESNTQEQHTNS